MWPFPIVYARATVAPSTPAAPALRKQNPFTRRPRKRPDWLLVMVVILAFFTLLVACLVALPYW